MSKELVSSIDIAAPAERVWEVLIDFDAFPTWHPFITSAEGTVQVGGRLTLRMQPVGGSAVTLRPTVVEVVKERNSAGRTVLECDGCSTPTSYSLSSHVVLGGRDSSSKSSSAVCSYLSTSGRWTAAHCRRSAR